MYSTQKVTPPKGDVFGLQESEASYTQEVFLLKGVNGREHDKPAEQQPSSIVRPKVGMSEEQQKHIQEHFLGHLHVTFRKAIACAEKQL